MSTEQKKVRQFKCKSCGGGLELHNKRTRYVSCPYCGSIADAGSDEFLILTKNENPSKFPPRSFLKLGMTGRFSQLYKIIGRTFWSSDYMEYWQEDGETGYSSEKWTFDEWLLLGEDGTYVSLLEDAEGFHFSQSFIPKYPSIPEGQQVTDFNNEKNRRAQEYGTSKILYFEGESTYLVETGKVVGFSQYADFSASYLAEWRLDENNELKEVEYFKETSISKKKVIEAFQTDEEREASEIKRAAKYKLRKKHKRIFAYAGLINIILGIILSAMFASKTSSSSSLSFTNKFSANAIIQTNEWQKVDNDWKSITELSEKKFKISPENKNISVFIRYTVPVNDFKGLYTVFIKNSKGDIVFEYSQFNYHYNKFRNTSAHNDAAFSDYFSLNNVNDEFTVGVTYKLPANYVLKSDSKVGTEVTIQSIKKRYEPGSFVGFGILMLIISLFTIKGSKPESLKKKK